ncbi:hypothetical protein [Pseudomonas sp. BN515]|uniref:cupin domain-containing protein n=1 Tax=Pseudomonas sp. BN515 TaxID=2567892 RepID=UPI002454BBDE|nr:hypothetical protein [Pseudomonas sp. BN515]MDH4872016.1 hypothetical protein [Pseudomonas sp. BN515]
MSDRIRSQVSSPLAANAQAPVALEGDALRVALRNFRQGERIEGGLDCLGEEVGVVLEGAFEVSAAGEHYHLVAGEGIVIPPEEARSWVCASETGALYRVMVKQDHEGLPA